MKLIVTIPALNEAPTIGAVIREIPRQMDGIDRVEVLVIDDGSRDETVEEALRAGADYVISNRLNRGLAATFKTALQEACRARRRHHRQHRRRQPLRPDAHPRTGRAAARARSRHRHRQPAHRRAADEARRTSTATRSPTTSCSALLRLPDVDVSTGFRAYTPRSGDEAQRAVGPHVHARDADQRARPAAAHRQRADGGAARRAAVAADQGHRQPRRGARAA